MKELTEEQKKKLDLEILNRLNGIVRLWGDPDMNFGKETNLATLPKWVRDLMYQSFQEGIKFWGEKQAEIDKLPKEEIPF